MPFGFSDTFVVEPISKMEWGKPAFANDDEKKKQFGVELAKGHKTVLDAAQVVFKDLGQALWVSSNWLSDPIVEASKNLHLKTTRAEATLLDKNQLAARLLQFAEFQELSEPKESLAAYKLYAELQGFLVKPDPSASTNIINNNQMIVKLVRAENKTKTIDAVSNKSEILENVSPITVKLVSAK